MHRHLIPALAVALLANRADAQLKALEFRAVIDSPGHVIPNGVILVDGDKISAVVAADYRLPANTQVIDLTRYTAIPGMIDVHTHMTYYWDSTSGTDPWRQPQRTPAQTVQLARANAVRTLETGVTTVRDLGSSNYMDIALRDSINKAGWLGPRMFVAGYGLQKARPPFRPNTDTTHTQRGRVFSIAQIPEAVKQQVDAGADYIKVYGSTGTGADVTGNETFTYEEMKAAVDAAKSFGKRIAIHSYGPEGGRDAVRAGVTSLEHAINLEDSTLARMAHDGVFYVPTIDHNRYYAQYRDAYHYTAEQAAGLDSFRLLNIETARRAYRAGVKLGMGSDAVHIMFGQNTRELGWFVQMGMTPSEALATATTNGAAILGMENSLGRIAPGYFADIAAVDGDPLTDIHAVIDRVRWVMKGGAVVVDKTR